MNINELFEELQDNVLEELNGEIILEGNCIVWSYDIDRDGIAIIDDTEDDDDLEFDFGSIKSSEELLQDAYDEDLFSIQSYVDGLEDNNWTFSEPEIGETTISIKIF
jgi:hypothetical protein